MTRSISPFPERENYSISKGERHLLVMLLQIMLDALKIYYDCFDAVTVSGVYDDVTEKAISDYQKLVFARSDGKVDHATWNRLAADFDLAVKDNQQ